jgi:hypothetical protein
VANGITGPSKQVDVMKLSLATMLHIGYKNSYLPQKSKKMLSARQY